MKKLLSLALTAAILGGVPVVAAQAEPPAPDDLYLLAEPSEYGDIALVGPSEGTAWTFSFSDSADMLLDAGDGAGSAFPSSYDPRGSGALTPVRSQGQWNTCWALAAVGAAELDGLKNGLLDTDAAHTDLSERHLVYFFSHQSDDPLGNSSGDYNVNPAHWIVNGGNPIIAAMTMANWHGVAGEAETASSYDGMSKDDRLDDAHAYTAALRLENTWTLDISDAAGRERLKGLLLEHGAAVLCMYYSGEYLFAGSPSVVRARDEAGPSAEGVGPEGAAEETAPPDESEPPLPIEEPGPDADGQGEQTAREDAAPIAPVPVGLDGAAAQTQTAQSAGAEDYTVCYYQNARVGTNHEVVIVGWDDGYPADNFALSEAGAVPPADGAWLCRNSIGADWAGGDGYFWLSYYDASAACPTGGDIGARATVFQFMDPDEFDNNYEYDGAVVLSYANDSVGGAGLSTLSAGADSSRYYANVFTASANDEPRGVERLRAVSTYAYRAGVPYTVEVYVGLSSGSDPTSGTLAVSQSGVFDYAGFHTVRLDEAVTLREGETFSVVFRVGRAEDGSIFVPTCKTSAAWYSENDIRPGQSFASVDGQSWLDGADLKSRPNVRVKAYTDNDTAAFPFTDVAVGAWYYEDVRDSWRKGLVEGMTGAAYAPEKRATRAQIVAVLRRVAGSPDPERGETAFDDVSAGAWYYDDVLWAEDLAIIAGSDDDGDGVYSFRPNATITREELMTILYRFAARQDGVTETEAAELSSFSDSGRVHAWAADAVKWSVSTGLMKGSASGSDAYLLPQGRVTRAQLAAFLNRLTFS